MFNLIFSFAVTIPLLYADNQIYLSILDIERLHIKYETIEQKNLLGINRDLFLKGSTIYQ